MLIKATVDDIKKYGDFIYQLALNPAKSCYPTYADGIKTKIDFLVAAERAVKEETSELLLFSVDEIVEGWITYFWIPEDKYLQLTGFNINCRTQQALTEFFKFIETMFDGYTAYFGYSEVNRDAICFLEKQGFRCIEKNCNHSFFFDSYTLKEHSSDVERVSQNNFDKFRAVYCADPEAYWNADRIFEAIDDWTIFVYNQADTPIAAIFLTGEDGCYEVFGAEFIDGIFRENVFRELLTASLNECKHMGARYMTYFCGEDEKAIMDELGFKYVGQYFLYMKVL